MIHTFAATNSDGKKRLTS